MSDSEFSYDSDQDVSASHSKLVEAVAQLDKGQRVKKPERSEPTLQVSEFHLVKSGISDKDAVQLQDLARSLGKKGHHAEITKRLQATEQKAKVLSKPLEKPAAERIKRVVGYENTTKELKKWNAVVTQNRVAQTVSFPLGQTSIKPETSSKFVKKFRIQSELEKELAALEPQKENIKQDTDTFATTLEEVMLKRKEAAKLRAQQSYKEARAARQKKIKSKKFHRVQRKEKVKLQIKEFETLQKTDPQAALEKLEQLDKSRAEERMTLRHKSTGQWAKNKQIRAKYDKETRQVLAEQLSIGREITQKIKSGMDSDEDEEDVPMKLSANDKENPWVGGDKTDTEINDFIQSYRQYWDTQNKKLENQTDTTVNTKTSISNKRTISSEDAVPVPSTEKNQDTDCDTESAAVEIQETEPKPKKLKKEKPSRKLSNKKEEVKEVTPPTESQVQSVSMVSSTKKSKSRSKSATKIVATSSWDVETMETEVTANAPNTRLHSDTPSEKLDDMFDSMEEKLQKQVELKLKTVKEKYDLSGNKGKFKTGNRIAAEKDQFDGLEFKTSKQKPIIDGSLDEIAGSNSSQSNIEIKKLSNIQNDTHLSTSKPQGSEAEIDPNKYINVKPKHLHTQLPDTITGGNDNLDNSEDEEENHNIISEAFADDDVVEQFRKEKEDEIKKGQPEDIDLSLPGWGSWGGKNIKVSNRKKKRFIMKFPKEVPRKDENKGDVIIIEEENAKIKAHQVSDLPFPFTSVKDFEASVRMPLGRNFVSENSHKKLIEPAVKTAIGKVIEPMTEDVLVKKSDRSKNLIPKRDGKIKKRFGPKPGYNKQFHNKKR